MQPHTLLTSAQIEVRGMHHTILVSTPRKEFPATVRQEGVLDTRAGLEIMEKKLFVLLTIQHDSFCRSLSGSHYTSPCIVREYLVINLCTQSYIHLLIHPFIYLFIHILLIYIYFLFIYQFIYLSTYLSVYVIILFTHIVIYLFVITLLIHYFIYLFNYFLLI